MRRIVGRSGSEGRLRVADATTQEADGTGFAAAVAGANDQAGRDQPVAACLVGDSPTPGALANEPVFVDGETGAHLSSTIGLTPGGAQRKRCIPAWSWRG
jgi:hypothetical protein